MSVVTSIGRCKKEMTQKGCALFCAHKKSDPLSSFDPETCSDDEEVLLDRIEYLQYEYGHNELTDTPWFEKYPAAIVAVIEAAKALPRYTHAPGAAGTEHPFQISAAAVWALDKALKDIGVETNTQEQNGFKYQNAGIPDDIRREGWMVAVHNDYRLIGAWHTFWLFTKGDRCVKGEGKSDAEALNLVRDQIGIAPIQPQ